MGVGRAVGRAVGIGVGAADGRGVGAAEGAGVGRNVGAKVGTSGLPTFHPSRPRSATNPSPYSSNPCAGRVPASPSAPAPEDPDMTHVFGLVEALSVPNHADLSMPSWMQ